MVVHARMAPDPVRGVCFNPSCSFDMFVCHCSFVTMSWPGLSPCQFSSLGTSSAMCPWFFVCVVIAVTLVCLSRAGDDAWGSSCCHGRDLTCAELVSYFCAFGFAFFVLLVCVLRCWWRGCLVWGARFLFVAYRWEARIPLGGAALSCLLHVQTFLLGDEWIPAMSNWLSLKIWIRL